MFDWIRENQLDIMLSLSSICGILAFFVVITSINGKKKKALFFLELSAMVLLISDRFAYIYRGNVSDLGYWMVRISNFLVFAMTIMTVYCFGKYLKEMAAESDSKLADLKRFRIVDIMLYIGELLLVISQFTGLYYTFDETNHYVRSDYYIISYILPFLGLVILLSIIVQYYKKLSKSMRLSVLLFTLCPLIASVCQLFLYGISATDITLVGTVVLLYIFDLLYMNKTAAESERAKAESNAKSAFLSNMSHEIRTPINAILGMNEMILRESDDENILEYSENVRTAGSTLLGIVNDILDFSKIEAGKMEIIPVDYDLSTVLNDLVNMIQTRADDKGLLLKLEFDHGIPKLLHGDEVRLKQVITNILTNAVKYTEKGSVTFGVTYEKSIDSTDSIDLKVWIKDTGIGIKPQDMEKLFSEFQRIDEERNRHVEGTGLGMSITRRLLEMMNSSLKVESVYGEGSTFSFILMQKVVKWDALGDYEAAYKVSLSHHKKYREKFMAPDAAVLMVDDTPMNLTVFKSLLKLTGIRIDTASSGDEGLALARKNKYDIIFLDHMMPEKDGIETLHEMQSWEDYPNKDTKKVCLTANAISGAREQYLAAGFDNYLTKPIDSAKLEEMLLEYLPEHKILDPGAAQSEPAGADNDDIIPQFVRDIAEIDIEAGIRNNGDAGSYVETLKTYAGMVGGHIDDIERFMAADDIANATIKIHALKSTSRIIGAADIGELAQKLETAGKENDTDTLNNELGGLLERCRKLGEQLSPLVETTEKAEDDESLPFISEDELREAYALIKEANEAFQFDNVNEIAESLRDYRIPDAEKERVRNIIKAVSELEYDKLPEIIG